MPPLRISTLMLAWIAALPSLVVAQRPVAPARAASASSRTPAAERPNVVILVVDDLGYHDLGAHGSAEIPTPNIDRLAKSGVRFTDAYMISPLCSPSRAGILTGRYPQRWGQEFNPGSANGPDSLFGIPRDVPTVAERFKTLGYATGAFGKWHLGYRPQQYPTARGFDEFYGFLGATHHYERGFNPFDNGPLLRGSTKVREKSFLTEAFGREAVSFIDRHAASPFLLYVAFNAAHTPMVDDERHIARVSAISDPMRRRYASIVVGMDDAVGRIIGALDRNQLRGKTLVFFMSDNGGPTKSTTASNVPLRGIKGQMFEGGVRVPLIASWPGHLAQDSTYHAVMTSLDVAPTALAAAGAPIETSSFDGTNLLPVLQQSAVAAAPPQRVFWRLGEEEAMRDGSWKLIRIPGQTLLFDLSADIGESKNLAAQKPAIVSRMSAEYNSWAAQMQTPRWGKRGWLPSMATEVEH